MQNLLTGLEGSLHLANLFYVVLGVAIGMFGGALPGLNASILISLVLPFTYPMSPDTSIVLLAAIYVGAEYGGSISGILINTPGHPAGVAVVFDGYPLTKAGYPRKALSASLVPGVFGGLVSNVALILVAIPLSELALHFGPAEFFALGVLGLSLVAGLAAGSWVKGVLSAAVGLLVATIGTDPITGFARFTFDNVNLGQGIGIVPALIGVLAVSEAFALVDEYGVRAVIPAVVSKAFPNAKEWRRMAPAAVRGTIIGILTGAVPGAGASVASFIAYNEQRRSSKHPELYGKGQVEGIAAPEAANVSVTHGSLIPSLTLGIPGSISAAILISALAIHGVQPGPGLMKGPNAYVVYTLFASQFLAAVVLLILGLLCMGLWIRVASVNKLILAPVIVVLAVFGAFAYEGSVWDVGISIVFGIVGYIMKRLKIPIAPFVLALVLAFLVEANFRRVMLLSGGDISFFFRQPIAVVILSVAVITLAMTLFRERRAKKRQ